MDDHYWLFISRLWHQISILGHIPLSFTRFVWAVVRGLMISVAYLPHDFDIWSYTEAYFPIFFEYPRDWDSGQFGSRSRLVWSFWAIDYVITSLHGFVEIEMDHIGFHQRNMVGPLAKCSWDRFVFIVITLQIGLPRWAVFCALWDLPFEIRRQGSFSDTEISFSLDFSEVYHDASVSDLLISADDWFTGLF